MNARALAVTLTAAVAGSLLGTTTRAVAAPARSHPHGLQIVVVGLPDGAAAPLIKVAGPDGFRKKTTSDTTTYNKAPRGRYTITVTTSPACQLGHAKLSVRVKATVRRVVTIRCVPTTTPVPPLPTSPTQPTSPTPQAPLSGDITSLSAGATHTCAIKGDHTAWCWGDNSYGMSGTAANDGYQGTAPSPVQITGGPVWASISAGRDDTCAVRLDHTGWCWGWNDDGELATSTNFRTTDPNPDPVELPDGPVWSMLSAGSSHVCGVRLDHSGGCWGSNQFGALGADGTVSSSSSIIAMDGTVGWLQVSAGAGFTCGVRLDHSAACWGYNHDGELGSTTHNGTTTPTPDLQVLPGTGWDRIDAGTYHACGVKTDHTGWCWGRDSEGQLGATPSAGGYVPTPIAVPGDGVWSSLEVGDGHTCGLRLDQTLWCWGGNTYGQLSGTGAGGPTAVQVGSAGWTLPSADGGSHTCGARAGELWCWGLNDWDQLGTTANAGSTTANPTPLRVSGF